MPLSRLKKFHSRPMSLNRPTRSLPGADDNDNTSIFTPKMVPLGPKLNTLFPAISGPRVRKTPCPFMEVVKADFNQQFGASYGPGHTDVARQNKADNERV